MIEQNTNETLVQVSEENLQDVSGGCPGCLFATSVLNEQALKALTNAKNHSDIASKNAEARRGVALTKIINTSLSSQNNESVKGFAHCSNLPKIMKEAAPHIH